MLRKITLSLISLFLVSGFLLSSSSLATYDPLSVPNNKFGIHILDSSEVEKASQFVNTSGGDWGYITIPIPANERNLPKWTKFMRDCAKFHLIPILRIAQFGSGNGWAAPNEWDLIDFANFLDELPWPIKNRYVVIYNEPNHESEWGGFVYPEEYALVLDRAIDIFHKKNPDYFVISAGLDSSAPNSDTSIGAYLYFRKMNEKIPGIFSKVDGVAFHAYGNPNFSAYPNFYSSTNIGSYKQEIAYIRNLVPSTDQKYKIFLTEAGWKTDLLSDQLASSFYSQAFSDFWIEPEIVAITPFVLTAQAGPFQGFSFVDNSGQFKPFAKKLIETSKIRGEPSLADTSKINIAPEPPTNNPEVSQESIFTPLTAFIAALYKFLFSK